MTLEKQEDTGHGWCASEAKESILHCILGTIEARPWDVTWTNSFPL